jgi:hypothetical protein
MFTHRFIASVAGTTLTAAALGMATLGLAGTANAAATDKEFLAAVEQAGISVDNPQQVINVAKNVCSALDRGNSANSILSDITSKTDLTTNQGKSFIVDSVQAYCPEHLQGS